MTVEACSQGLLPGTPHRVLQDVLVAQNPVLLPDLGARTVLEHHLVDSSHDVRAECVSREPARERPEVVVVRHAHDDPFDDICVRKDADVHERRAPRVHAPERVERATATAIDEREERDCVAPDLHDDVVVNSSRHAVQDVAVPLLLLCEADFSK